ncbi:MAG: DUF6273 domain-containing protein [Candidatus Faecousia sp.]|nr:DUF6273 domain-containing protein [Candidatus Faecousia sp.]
MLYGATEETLRDIRDRMAKSSETSPKEDTLEKIHESLKQIAASVTGKVEDVDNWEQVAAAVQSGKHVLTFNTGDQLIPTWKDASGATYDDPFDIVEVECSPELQNGQAVHGMMLQQHYANIANCPFDPQEALYDADEELPAGTYHFTVAGDTWLTSENGKKIQFTLTKPIPKGGQLVYANTEGCDVALAGQKISTYSGPMSFTAIETVALSEGEGGTDLGSTDGKGKLNHHQRAFRGCGRWKTSMLRQYLNSNKVAGQWWSKQDKWDRASAFINSVPGFLAGFPVNFLGILRPVKVCTARDTLVLDGGTDITYDSFFPVSLEQLMVTPQAEGVEGKALSYWKEIAANSTDLDSSGRFKQYGTYPLLRTYGLNAKSSARNCWLRSAHRGNSCNAWSVSASGSVGGSSALTGYSCAPACVIVAPQSSAANPLAASEG